MKSGGLSLGTLGVSPFTTSTALRLASIAALAAWTLGSAGCAQPDDEEDLGVAQGALESENGLSPNGLSTNGLSTNGLSTNGLSTNGLSTNGLSTNGLSTNGFKAWFDANTPVYSAMVMKYLVRCALPEGQSRTFVSSAGVSYTWPGLFGLAPAWSAGSAIPVDEQQLVSACLAAHVNKYGLHIDISVRGYMANGDSIPVTSEEREEFDLREACFFGNVFNGQGVYAAPFNAHLLDADDDDAILSSPRACSITEPWNGGDCSPYLPRLAGRCKDYCTGQSGAKFGSCTLNGVTYKPITTTMRRDDLYECGDDVCQVTEVPYSISTGVGCHDCGTVP